MFPASVAGLARCWCEDGFTARKWFSSWIFSSLCGFFSPTSGFGFKEIFTFSSGKSSPTYYYYYTHPGRLSLGDLLRFKPSQFIIDHKCGILKKICVFTAFHSGSSRWSSWLRRWTSTSSTTLSTCPPTSTRSFSSSRATAYLSSRYHRENSPTQKDLAP